MQHQTPADYMKEHYARLYDVSLKIGDIMYGTKERTWLTLAITFGMLVFGISLMQGAVTGGMCAAG